MTGLNLETFLQLLRVAPGAWASLAVALVILALMTWTSWGSRRVLRKCLFLSITAHIVLIFYGGSSPEIQRFFRLGSKPSQPAPKIPRIKVSSVVEPSRTDPSTTSGKSSTRPVSAWDRDGGTLALGATPHAIPHPDLPTTAPAPRPTPPRATDPIAAPAAAPDLGAVAPSAPDTPTRVVDRLTPVAEVVAPEEGAAPVPDLVPAGPAIESAPAPSLGVASADLRTRTRPQTRSDVAPLRAAPPPAAPAGALALPAATPTGAAERDLIPPPTAAPAPTFGQSIAANLPDLPLPTLDEPATSPTADPAPTNPVAAAEPSPTSLLPGTAGRRSIRSGRPAPGASPSPAPVRSPEPAPAASGVGSLAQVTPSVASAMPTLPRAIGRRPLAEVPPVYRSRLDPNRTVLAQRAGASRESELAVERALEWLARHQDADGRWDGGTVKFRDGRIADNDDTFYVHCPAGDICYGECYYGEADTALTGLALLAYLGAGYTHTDANGKYADVVGRGISFLRQSQKPDGDLRGSSLAVGMYCHAMATLALCEAYALTGDPALRSPVERGIAFLVQSRALDGMAWRYAPGAPTGDTSILGWAVMALKSAKTVGIPIPPPIQSGIANWLGQVASGRSGGLARYQPMAGAVVTPTMTAEAWACRQFLELGGPGPTSDEAAASLLASPTDRGKFNVYYLYYGTLAMYQHGGAAWTAWNARVRDQVVARQQTEGHKLGSWDPDDSPYGTHGGRIYSTALATLTLEVYYRFLRLYSTPEATTPLAPRPTDPGARRAGLTPPRPAAGR